MFSRRGFLTFGAGAASAAVFGATASPEINKGLQDLPRETAESFGIKFQHPAHDLRQQQIGTIGAKFSLTPNQMEAIQELARIEGEELQDSRPRDADLKSLGDDLSSGRYSAASPVFISKLYDRRESATTILDGLINGDPNAAPFLN